MDTVLLAEKYSKMAADASARTPDVRVIGVDLSGDPRVRTLQSCTLHVAVLGVISPQLLPQAGDMNKLLPVLKTVKEKDLKLAMHLSEVSHTGILS